MSKNLNLVYLLLFALFTSFESLAQDQVIDSLQICFNGNFEASIESEYAFATGFTEGADIDCDYDTSGLAAEVVSGSSGNVTLTSSGYDSILQVLSPPVYMNQVHLGYHSIKLNDDVADQGVTTMTKFFDAGNEGLHTFVAFNYSIIMQTNSLSVSEDLPRFIVRVYNSSGLQLGPPLCIDPVDDACLFNSSTNANGAIYYTGWRCHTIWFDEELISDPATIEFTIIDGNNTNDYATVYLDDICDKESCPNEDCSNNDDCEWCIDLHTDISTGADLQKTENCIYAYNTIASGATALYHAGHYGEGEELVGEIVLLPADGEDSVGFECLLGSTGHFYIEDCETGEFAQRVNIAVKEEIKRKSTGMLQIYPNPTNGELNILSSEAAVRSVTLMGLDGKVIMRQQPGAESNKSLKLDTHCMSSGIYILSIETVDGAVTTHKILKE